MPVLPPVGTGPLDTVNYVLNIARARVNDAINGIAGEVLNNSQAYTQVYTNSAWRRTQYLLADLGISKLTREAILTNLPIVAGTDPSTQVKLNWASYFDGNSDYAVPVLPPDLIIPLKLWERWSGTQSDFAPMKLYIDGMPSRAHQARNGIWEWRDNAIFLPGATRLTDLRVRYAATLGDFLTQNNINWFDQVVPIPQISDTFSFFICAEFSEARGDASADSFAAKADAAARKVFNRDVAQRQRTNISRIPRSRSAMGGGGYYGNL